MTTRLLPFALPFALTTLAACPADELPQSDTDAGSSEGGPVDPDTGDDTTTAAPIACPEPTQGPTHHDDDIVGHEVWTAEGSPHLVDWTVDVRGGATLEIEPCAVVQFAAGHGMNVAYPGTPTTGTLIAEGTAEQPIRFEGQDGARWGHLFVNSPGTARLAHLTIEGGGGVDVQGASLVATGEGTWPTQESLFVDHVTVRDSLGVGVVVRRLAAFAEGSTDLIVTDSGDDAHPWPMIVDEHALDSLPRGDYTGNAIDKILVEPQQSLREDSVMRELGVPYLVGNGNDLVVGSGDDTAPATLTIEPGVTIEFAAGSAFEVEHYTGEFMASGIVVARGTADAPITFTSAAADPQPGDWIGLWFGGIVQPATRLEHVRIEYTGADCGCILLTCSDIDQFEGAVIVSQPPPSEPFITDSVIAHGGAHGFVLGYDGGAVDFRSANTFEDMAGCPMTQPRDGACPDPRPSCME